MSDGIVIDAKSFFERLQVLQNLWKQDKRQNDQLFGGAESFVVLNGKSESETNFQKNNALHVCSSVK